MSRTFAISGASIFDGERFIEDQALLVGGDRIAGLCPRSDIPGNYSSLTLEGGALAPAHVDLQVNGGGGILLNDQPDLEGIRTICHAHATLGTGALLPTLITDAPHVTASAIEAGIAAARENVAGFLGLHLEGPHLAIEKKGAHDPAFIRPMEDNDLRQLLEAKRHLPVLKITVAPEAVTVDQVSALSQAGILVSLGHSASSYADVQAAASAGAGCITHLFNAMSPLSHREPGMVGAALQIGTLHAGLIADGFHVAPEVIAIALAAKKGPGEIFLVSDAMATVGADINHFLLNGRLIKKRDGRLTLEDGTLAGSDLTMHSAVMFMKDEVGISLDRALTMASRFPARCIGDGNQLGCLRKGSWANILHLDEHFEIDRVWIRGALT